AGALEALADRAGHAADLPADLLAHLGAHPPPLAPPHLLGPGAGPAAAGGAGGAAARARHLPLPPSGVCSHLLLLGHVCVRRAGRGRAPGPSCRAAPRARGPAARTGRVGVAPWSCARERASSAAPASGYLVSPRHGGAGWRVSCPSRPL